MSAHVCTCRKATMLTHHSQPASGAFHVTAACWMLVSVLGAAPEAAIHYSHSICLHGTLKATAFGMHRGMEDCMACLLDIFTCGLEGASTDLHLNTVTHTLWHAAASKTRLPSMLTWGCCSQSLFWLPADQLHRDPPGRHQRPARRCSQHRPHPCEGEP